MCQLPALPDMMFVRGSGVWSGGRVVGLSARAHVPGEHGPDLLQVPTASQQPRSAPHLVVVAVLQYHHGDGAGSAASWGPRVCLRSRRVSVALQHFPEVACLLQGPPAFPGRQAAVQREFEGIRHSAVARLALGPRSLVQVEARLVGG